MDEHLSPGEQVVASLDRIASGLWWRLVLDRMFGRFPLLAGAALVPALLLSLFPAALPEWAATAVWSGLVVAGLLALAVPALLRRTTAQQAAAWLDGRLDSQELFSAALAVIGRDSPGPFDRLLIDRAEARMLANSDPSFALFPVRRLRFITLRAASLCLVALMLLALAPALVKASRHATLGFDEMANIPSLARASEASAARDLPPAVLEEARKLFPDDPRLSALAAQALADNDSEALDFLMGQAGAPREPGAKSGKDAQPNPRATSLPSQPPGDKGMQGAGPGTSPGQQKSNPKSGKSGQEGTQGQNRDQAGKSGGQSGADPGADPGRGQPKGKQPGTGDQSTEDGKAGDQPGDEAANGGQQGGNQPGQGAATERVGSRGVRLAPGPELLINKNPQSGQYEMVLGGKGPRTALSQVLPAAQTGALSGFGQKPPPLQYESYVRSYFRALSQEATQ